MTQKKKIVLPVVAEVPVQLTAALPLPPTTTEQEDIQSQEERAALHRMRDSQRRINLIWESTQGVIAIMLVLTVSISMLLGNEVKNEFWLLVAIVVQAYFQRTNHTRVGGVGEIRPNETR